MPRVEFVLLLSNICDATRFDLFFYMYLANLLRNCVKKSQLRTSCHVWNHWLRKDKDKSTGAVAVVIWRRQVRCFCSKKLENSAKRLTDRQEKMGRRVLRNKIADSRTVFNTRHRCSNCCAVKFACHESQKKWRDHVQNVPRFSMIVHDFTMKIMGVFLYFLPSTHPKKSLRTPNKSPRTPLRYPENSQRIELPQNL